MRLSTLGLRALTLFFLLAAPLALRAQNWQWIATHNAGTTNTGSSYVNATIPDGSGNFIAVGAFTGTISLGGSTLTSAGGRDLFIAHLSSSGVWSQAIRAGGVDDDVADYAALDNSGNLTITGIFSSPTLNLGGIALAKTSEYTIYVARLSPAGTWIQGVTGGAGNFLNFVQGFAMDGAGNVTIIGNFFSRNISFGTFTLSNTPEPGSSLSNINLSDSYVARLSSAGVWTQLVGAHGPNRELILGVALAPNGDAVIAGSFTSPTLRLGPTTLTNIDNTGIPADLFVARLNSAGTWTQAVRAGGTNHDFASLIALDGNGDAVIAGHFTSPTLNFGTTTLNYAYPGSIDANVFVARLSSAGVWTQAAQTTGPGDQHAWALVVDASGTITVGGTFIGASCTMGGTTLTNPTPNFGLEDIFVARLGNTGTWTQAMRIGSAGSDYLWDIDLDGSGNAILSGQVEGPVASFGSTPLAVANSTGFVARVTGLATATTAPASPRPSP
jgi:hypothetical protein